VDGLTWAFRRVARTRIWSCGDFFSCKFRGNWLILGGNVPESLFGPPANEEIDKGV
jgi:hypothetical protein